jgi:hypothetical protein
MVLALVVPDGRQPAIAPDAASTGAVTQLGFVSGYGGTSWLPG